MKKKILDKIMNLGSESGVKAIGQASLINFEI